MPSPFPAFSSPSPAPRARWVFAGVAARLSIASMVALAGCDSLATIDRRTDEKLRESAALVGDATAVPRYDASRYANGTAYPSKSADVDQPATVNPKVEDLHVARRDPRSESTQSIISRFASMTEAPPDAETIEFAEAMSFAQEHAPEYLTAEESYIITALRTLIEEHRWGPTFFNETSAVLTASGSDTGRYTTALSLLNDFGVSQRLPYGGEVSARFLVDATQQLDNAIGNDSQSADVILSANIPLLRGAGTTADESRTLARRELVYAARDFQQFRRSFYVDLARDYLSLIFQKQQITNADRQVKRSQEVEDRTVALVNAGRTEPFQADLARQNTLFAADRLAQLKENHRLSMDRFKLRIGMDTTRPIDVAATAFSLPLPDVTLDGAVELALKYRLDLQTEADRVADAARNVDVARNDLEGDLNLALSGSLPTDSRLRRAGVQFRPREIDYIAGITYSLPLDRTTEEARYREAQIRLEQQRRTHLRFRDSVAVEARGAVREIEKSQLSLLINERSVEASNNRLAAIEAAPERATARDRTEAVNNLQRAQDGLEQAKRDLQVAILDYLEVTGQLRVSTQGVLTLPSGLADQPAGSPSPLDGPSDANTDTTPDGALDTDAP